MDVDRFRPFTTIRIGGPGPDDLESRSERGEPDELLAAVEAELEVQPGKWVAGVHVIDSTMLDLASAGHDRLSLQPNTATAQLLPEA